MPTEQCENLAEQLVEFKWTVFHEAIHHMQWSVWETAGATAAPLLFRFRLLADAAVPYKQLQQMRFTGCATKRTDRQHTCLEDLVAHRESRPVSLIVGDELDEELAAAGDDRRRRDLPAELSQHG